MSATTTNAILGCLVLVQMAGLCAFAWNTRSRWWFWPGCAAASTWIATLRCHAYWPDSDGWLIAYAAAAGALTMLAGVYWFSGILLPDSSPDAVAAAPGQSTGAEPRRADRGSAPEIEGAQ